MSLFKEKLELKIEEAEFKAQRSLSGFRPWQKWTVFICLIGAVPGYFAARTFGRIIYEKQSQKFLILARPGFSEAEKLFLDRTDVASLGENEFSAVVQIVNPNLDLSAKNLTYEMKFLSAGGAEAAAPQSGKFYILPGQRKYLVAPKIHSKTGIASISLRLPEVIPWQKKINLPQVRLIMSPPKGRDELSPFGYALEGGVTNQSPYLIRETELIFLLYGPGGKIIGASARKEFDLRPFEKRDYRQIWTGISGKNVVRAEAVGETNLLDAENLKSLESDSAGGAGDLTR